VPELPQLHSLTRPSPAVQEVERDREFALRQARLDSHFHAGLLSSDVTFITRLLASFAACDEPFVRAVTLDRYLRCVWLSTLGLGSPLNPD
jgi:hypothetical protein